MLGPLVQVGCAALLERKVAGSITTNGSFHSVGPCKKAVFASLATDVNTHKINLPLPLFLDMQSQLSEFRRHLAYLSKLTVGASFTSVIEIVNALVRLNPLLSVARIETVCVVLFS